MAWIPGDGRTGPLPKIWSGYANIDVFSLPKLLLVMSTYSWCYSKIAISSESDSAANTELRPTIKLVVVVVVVVVVAAAVVVVVVVFVVVVVVVTVLVVDN